jgi:hypothetical protein
MLPRHILLFLLSLSLSVLLYVPPALLVASPQDFPTIQVTDAALLDSPGGQIIREPLLASKLPRTHFINGRSHFVLPLACSFLHCSARLLRAWMATNHLEADHFQVDFDVFLNTAAAAIQTGILGFRGHFFLTAGTRCAREPSYSYCLPTNSRSYSINTPCCPPPGTRRYYLDNKLILVLLRVCAAVQPGCCRLQCVPPYFSLFLFSSTQSRASEQ